MLEIKAKVTVKYCLLTADLLFIRLVIEVMASISYKLKT